MKRTLGSALVVAPVVVVALLAAACGDKPSSPVAPSVSTTTASSSVSSSGPVHVDGAISSINQASRSLNVSATTVVVPTGVTLAASSGQIEFKDLQVEMEVHVVGTIQNGVVNAQQVQVDDKGKVEPQPSPSGANEVEFAGAIAAVGGSCPSLTLSVNGRMVTTSSATSFLEAACSALSLKDIVEVKGTAQADGSVAASRVQVDDDVASPNPEPQPGEAEVEFTGIVASVGGGCPALSLSIAGRLVKSTSATAFQDGSCGDVRANVTRLEVSGTASADGSVTATRLKFEK